MKPPLSLPLRRQERAPQTVARPDYGSVYSLNAPRHDVVVRLLSKSKLRPTVYGRAERSNVERAASASESAKRRPAIRGTKCRGPS